MSNLESINSRIAVLNAESQRINNERQVNIGKRETLSKQLEDAFANYKATYGVSLSAENLEAEISRVVSSKEEEVAKIENILNLIKSGRLEEANLLANPQTVEIKEEVVATTPVISQEETVSAPSDIQPVAPTAPVAPTTPVAPTQPVIQTEPVVQPNIVANDMVSNPSQSQVVQRQDLTPPSDINSILGIGNEQVSVGIGLSSPANTEVPPTPPASPVAQPINTGVVTPPLGSPMGVSSPSNASSPLGTPMGVSSPSSASSPLGKPDMSQLTSFKDILEPSGNLGKFPV